MNDAASAATVPPRRARIALVLFLLAAGPRLFDLGSPSLSTDEVKWIGRADRMVRMLREGEWRRFNAHLSHPGIPQSLGIGLAQRWGSRLGEWYDPVVAARLPIALVGAVVPPLLYAAAAPVWGTPTAVLAGTFLALDPRHIATSRYAHLDVVFGFFYSLTLWSFWRHREERRPLHGWLGAVSLAAAELSRTSGFVAGGTALLSNMILRRRSGRAMFDLGELRFVAVAALLFFFVFTKLWLPPLLIPKVERYTAPEVVVAAIDAIAVHAWIASVAAVTALAIGLWLRDRIWGLAAIVVGLALGVTVLVPDFTYNVAGFIRNLVNAPVRLQHRYYGEAGQPLPGKYLTVLLEGMPAPLFLALLIGLPVFAMRSFRDATLRARAGLAVTVAIGVFLLMAMQFDKVAYRYLMPIYPLLMLVSAWICWQALAAIPAIARRPSLPISAIAALLALTVLPVMPHYPAWESYAGGWLRDAIGLRPLLAHEGHDEAAAYLWRHAGPEDRVSAICYDDVLRYYWQEVLPRREHEPPKPAPQIGYYRLDRADFVVLSTRRRGTAPEAILRFADSHEPVVRVVVEGKVALEVFRVEHAEPKP